MKKKMRKFEEGGLSKAQEEWLGGADRSDPIIMARMRKAVPDEPKAAPKAESKSEMGPTKKTTVQEFRESIKKPFKGLGEHQAKVQSEAESMQGKTSLAKKLREKAGITSYKSGGSVKSSASRRADGCAIRGKTKGRMV